MKKTNIIAFTGFWQDIGSYGPAWGMLGTLLGLVNMMRAMGSDMSAIGEGMSLALITTLYGSVLANWICIPTLKKKLSPSWRWKRMRQHKRRRTGWIR